MRLFVETLGEALASGRAHVRGRRGAGRAGAAHGTPRLAAGRRSSRAVSSTATWRAHGEHIGWVEGEYLYLNPPVAYAAVSRLLAEQGSELPKKPATLWGEMLAAGWIALTDREPERRRSTYKKTIDGIGQEHPGPQAGRGHRGPRGA